MDDLWQATAEAIARGDRRLRPPGLRYRRRRRHGAWRRPLSARRDRRPLGPAILSLDSRAGGIARPGTAGPVADAALALTGQMPHASAPSALLAWIRDNEPERFARIATCLRLQGLAALLPDRHRRHRPHRGQHLLHRCPDPGLVRAMPSALFGLESSPDALPPVAGSGRDRRPRHAPRRPRSPASSPARRSPPACTTSPPPRSASAAMARASSPSSPAPIRSTRRSRPSPASTRAGSAATASSPADGTTWRSRRPPPPTTTGSSTRSAAPSGRRPSRRASIHALLAAEIDAALERPSTALFHPYLFGSPHGAGRQRRLPRPARLARPRRHAARGPRRHRLQPPRPCRRAARRLRRPRGPADRRRLAQPGLRPDVRRYARDAGHRHRHRRGRRLGRRPLRRRRRRPVPLAASPTRATSPRSPPTGRTRPAAPPTRRATACTAASPRPWPRSGPRSRPSPEPHP